MAEEEGASGVSQARLQPQVEEAEARRRSELLSPQVPGEPKGKGVEAPPAGTQPTARSQRVRVASPTDFFSLVRSFHSGDAGPPLQHSPSCCSGAYLPRGMRPLSSPPREGTPVPCIGRRLLPVDSRRTPLAGEELTHVRPCPQCSGHSSTGLGDTRLSPSTCLLGEVDAH